MKTGSFKRWPPGTRHWTIRLYRRAGERGYRWSRRPVTLPEDWLPELPAEAWRRWEDKLATGPPITVTIGPGHWN